MAKIFGPLEVAQLENLSSDPSTALAVGRAWINTATATRGVPKFYDGNAIRNFAVQNFNAIGNSGTSITIDWSIATTQSMTLTGNCAVTHSNMPTNGQVCTLIVNQASAIPLYKITFPTDNYWQKQNIPDLIPAGASRRFQFISNASFLPAVTSLSSYVSVNTNTVTGLLAARVSPDGNWVAWSDGTGYAKLTGIAQGPLSGLQWGAFTGTSAATVSGPYCFAWHPSGAYLAVGGQSSPYVQVFPVSNGIIGSAIPNPGSAPSGNVAGLAWSPAGDALVWVGATTPFIGGWPFTNGVFGTAYSNPASLPTAASSVKFHPGGLYLALGLNAAPGIAAYAFTSAGGFGTKSAAPSPATFLASQQPDAIDFSPDGLYVAMGCTATPFIHVWPFSSGGAFGTVVSNPATLPAGQVYGVAFSRYNDYLHATTQTGSTVLYSYPWAAAFGTLGSNPTTLPPTANLFGVQTHPTGEYVMWYGNTTPFMGIYAAPRVVKNVIASQY